MPAFLLTPFNLAFYLLTPAYAIPIRRVSYMLRKYSLYKAAHRLARRGTYSLKVLLFQLQHKALVYALFIGINLLRPALIHVPPLSLFFFLSSYTNTYPPQLCIQHFSHFFALCFVDFSGI